MVESQTIPTAVLSPVRTTEVIGDIEARILNAVNELLKRAYSDGQPDEPRILDQKSELPPEGTLQDCEFGLMILTVRSRLRDSLIGDIGNNDIVRPLTIALLKRTLERITEETTELAGGELEGSPIFFSGEPYTRYPLRNESCFSANLDAAMLILAFFAAALKAYDQEMVSISFTPPENSRELGVNNLRDASLLVCKEALHYATRCRVEKANRFLGFTCDPLSNIDDPARENQPLLSPEDRLFFTWTTCETLHELSGWTSYLDSIQEKTDVPGIVAEARTLLARLFEDLTLASSWCLSTEDFLTDFRKEEQVPPIVEMVTVLESFGEKGKPKNYDEITSKCASIANYVRKVYPLSQFAAIRSIAPSGLTIGEVRLVVDRLRTLVSEHILKSGLDAAIHQSLYQTLTKYYSVGKSPNKEYQDDAYFPLVVRSLSGLLSRTIAILSSVEEPETIRRLVSDYRDSLSDFYRELVSRVPREQDAENGDQFLWTVAKQRPYYLYATQRTLFALLAYKDFLLATERPSEPPPPLRPKSLQDQLREILAQSLAEVLLTPVVVERFVKQASHILPPSARSSPNNDDKSMSQLPFPKAEWTHQLLRNWLSRFTKDLDSDICDALLTDADCLIELRAKLSAAEENGTVGHLTEHLQGALKALLKVDKIKTLYDNGPWNEESIAKALFEHLLEQFLPPLDSIKTRMQELPLWKTIHTAKTRMEAYVQKIDLQHKGLK